MPYSNDYSDFQRWIDGIFDKPFTYNHTVRPIHIEDIIAAVEGANETKSECNRYSCKDTTDPFAIRSVLSNRRKNAFSVVWMDGTTTVVHCQTGDEWDDEKALAMCFTKKALGNKGNFNDKFNDALDNKMKIIPGGAGIISAEALRAEHADPSAPTAAEKYEEMTQEAIYKIKQSAEETAQNIGNAFLKLVDELASTPPSAPAEYKVSIRGDRKGPLTAGVYPTKEEAVSRARALAMSIFGKEPYYYRLWMEDDSLIIDFGSYTKFIAITGLTVDDWNKV